MPFGVLPLYFICEEQLIRINDKEDWGPQQGEGIEVAQCKNIIRVVTFRPPIRSAI